MIKFVFDVDGTLTPSRAIIDWEFEKWFEHWGTHNAYYLVTGSDKVKTREQLGRQIYNQAIIAYQCSGNDVWQQDRNIRSNEITISQGLLVELDKILYKSKFYVKTGQHIDYRPGLVNFSVIGRGCTFEERHMYKQWDDHKKEREKIASSLSRKFPKYNFQIAGETGIDITIEGNDKSQILKDFKDTDVIYFFGDNCQAGGNDHEIALAVNDRENGSRVFEVDGWEHTWSILKELE